MKRSILVATLALSPVLLHAQAAKPAQPVLQAGLSAPAMLSAAATPTAAANPVRISTGVVGPKLIYSVALNDNHDSPMRILSNQKTVMLSLIVDQTGKPVNLHVVQSAGSYIDSEVVKAVTQYRYQPATLDGQPTAVPINLSVVLPTGVRY